MGCVPQQCHDAQCPLATKAKNFSLHSGAIPPKSNICVILEMPGADEGVFLVKDLVDGAAEIARREERYPSLDRAFVVKGAPVVGRSGWLLWNWVMAQCGLQRSDVAVFNTLNCYCGKNPDGTFFYPKGNERKRAEATCASLWLDALMKWEPTVSIVAMHPSALVRDIVPLPMVLRAVTKAKVFAAKGERVLLLMGGKPAKHWLAYGENTSRWCVHHQCESAWTRQRRADRWTKGRSLMVEKAKRVKKLTAKTALEILLSRFAPNPMDADYAENSGAPLAMSAYNEMLALLAPKPKKVDNSIPVLENVT